MGCSGSTSINSIIDEIKEIEQSNVELHSQRLKPQNVSQSSKNISNLSCTIFDSS